MRTWHVVVAIGLFSFVARDARAQDAPDCAKCDVSVGPWAKYSVNQAVCPGANAIVCELQYDKEYKSACVAGFPILRECETVVNKKNYPTKAQPAGTCGTANKDAQGNVVSVVCPILGAGAPAGPPLNRDAHGCTGSAWLVEGSVPPEQEYVIAFAADEGTTTLEADTTGTLGDIRVGVPGALFRTAAARFRVEGDDVLFTLLLRPLDSGRFTFPDQTFQPAAGSGVRIDSSRLEADTLQVAVRIAKPNIGAFDSYDLDLRGLKLLPVAPVGGTAPVGSDLPPDDPNLIEMQAEVVGTDGVVISGLGVIGRLAVSGPALPPAPPPPTTTPSRLWLYVASALAALLLLSWLFFLLRRRRTA